MADFRRWTEIRKDLKNPLNLSDEKLNDLIVEFMQRTNTFFDIKTLKRHLTQKQSQTLMENLGDEEIDSEVQLRIEKGDYVRYDIYINPSEEELSNVSEENEKIYYMPVELLNTFKKKIKSKKVLERVKNNTNEYNLLLGFIATYGIIDFEFFYNKFSTTYNYEKDELLTRVKNLSAFYNEFKEFTDKTNLVYIASNSLKNMTEIKKYFKTDEYKEFSNEEILNIYTFKYMEKFLSYKKLKKFIKILFLRVLQDRFLMRFRLQKNLRANLMNMVEILKEQLLLWLSSGVAIKLQEILKL